jgi:hypothetical protein
VAGRGVGGDTEPATGERVTIKAHVERGLSLPPSEFFIEVFQHFGLQLQNLSPNSILCLSGFVALCEGHLGIKP